MFCYIRYIAIFQELSNEGLEFKTQLWEGWKVFYKTDKSPAAALPKFLKGIDKLDKQLTPVKDRLPERRKGPLLTEWQSRQMANKQADRARKQALYKAA